MTSVTAVDLHERVNKCITCVCQCTRSYICEAKFYLVTDSEYPTTILITILPDILLVVLVT